MKACVTLLALISLAACSTPEPAVPRPVVIQSQPIQRPALVLPSIDIVAHRTVEWKVLTPETAQELWDDLSGSGQPVVVFALSEQGYEALSLNTADALKIILQQQAALDAYREYYVVVEQKIDTHNAR